MQACFVGFDHGDQYDCNHDAADDEEEEGEGDVEDDIYVQVEVVVIVSLAGIASVFFVIILTLLKVLIL